MKNPKPKLMIWGYPHDLGNSYVGVSSPWSAAGVHGVGRFIGLRWDSIAVVGPVQAIFLMAGWKSLQEM